MLDNNKENKQLCISVSCQEKINQGEVFCQKCLSKATFQTDNMSRDEFFKKFEEEEGICHSCILRAKLEDDIDNLIKKENKNLLVEEMLREITKYWSKETNTPIQWSDDGDWVRVINSYIDKVKCPGCQEWLKGQIKDLENKNNV